MRERERERERDDLNQPSDGLAAFEAFGMVLGHVPAAGEAEGHVLAAAAVQSPMSSRIHRTTHSTSDRMSSSSSSSWIYASIVEP